VGVEPQGLPKNLFFLNDEKLERQLKQTQ